MNPLHFAFVACNRNAARFRDDPSFLYRCENMATALRADGHKVSTFHLSKFPLKKRFDAVIFHRPKHTMRLRLILSYLKFYTPCVLAADFDDLIFDPAFAEFSPGVMNRLVPLTTTRRNFLGHRRVMGQFTLITVSTEPLAEIVASLFPSAQIVLLPNTVYSTWRKAERAIHPPQKEPIITYFPGTRSHDRDFASIAEPLTHFLKKHPKVRLQITGPLQCVIPARDGQVSQHKKVPFDVYPEHFKDAWVNLAPLETTPFNRCKSALKVLEAGCWGVPTICSPIDDAGRFSDAGALKAASGDEWFDLLESLLDPDHYRIVTEDLRERVLKIADTTVFAARLVHAVHQVREEGG